MLVLAGKRRDAAATNTPENVRLCHGAGGRMAPDGQEKASSKLAVEGGPDALEGAVPHRMLISPSNFGGGRIANHVYVTATLDAATWGAELARGDGGAGSTSWSRWVPWRTTPT